MQLGVQLRGNFGHNVMERLKVVERAGVSLVEVDGKDLMDSFEEIQAHCQATGTVIVATCGGYRGWIGHFDDTLRQQAVSDIKEILSCCAQIGAQGIVVPAAYGMFSTRLNGKIAPRAAEEDESILMASLSDLNNHAKATNTTVFLEPLNRYEDHMLNTLEQAAHLIVTGQFSHVKLTADTFHMNMEEPRVEESVRKWAHLIGHVHVADSNRLQPGQGHMDFKRFFEALTEVNYTGAIIAECSWDGELGASIRTSMDFLQQQLPVQLR